jgi:hypothetical protein
LETYSDGPGAATRRPPCKHFRKYRGRSPDPSKTRTGHDVIVAGLAGAISPAPAIGTEKPDAGGVERALDREQVRRPGVGHGSEHPCSIFPDRHDRNRSRNRSLGKPAAPVKLRLLRARLPNPSSSPVSPFSRLRTRALAVSARRLAFCCYPRRSTERSLPRTAGNPGNIGSILRRQGRFRRGPSAQSTG